MFIWKMIIENVWKDSAQINCKIVQRTQIAFQQWELAIRSVVIMMIFVGTNVSMLKEVNLQLLLSTVQNNSVRIKHNLTPIQSLLWLLLLLMTVFKINVQNNLQPAFKTCNALILLMIVQINVKIMTHVGINVLPKREMFQRLIWLNVQKTTVQIKLRLMKMLILLLCQ